MKSNVRGILAESNIAAVAITVLLIWSIYWLVQAVERPVFAVLKFVITSIAIRDVPWMPPELYLSGRVALVMMIEVFVISLTYFLGAFILSKWVYGVGPVRALIETAARVKGGRRV